MVASGVLRTSYFVHSHRSHVASILVHTGYLWIWLDLVSPPPLFLPPRSYQGPTSQGRHAPSTDRSERLTKGIERERASERLTQKRGAGQGIGWDGGNCQPRQQQKATDRRSDNKQHHPRLTKRPLWVIEAYVVPFPHHAPRCSFYIRSGCLLPPPPLHREPEMPWVV